jgi:antitoxin MazE
MKKRLSTIGGSLGLVIDKPILELLKITRDTELELTTDGRGLYLRPIRPGSQISDEEVDRAFEKVNKKYSRALKNLAK